MNDHLPADPRTPTLRFAGVVFVVAAVLALLVGGLLLVGAGNLLGDWLTGVPS